MQVEELFIVILFLLLLHDAMAAYWKKEPTYLVRAGPVAAAPTTPV